MRPLNVQKKHDDKFKPQIFKFYDFTKGGMDTVDQMNDFLLRVQNRFVGS